MDHLPRIRFCIPEAAIPSMGSFISPFQMSTEELLARHAAIRAEIDVLQALAEAGTTHVHPGDWAMVN